MKRSQFSMLAPACIFTMVLAAGCNAAPADAVAASSEFPVDASAQVATDVPGVRRPRAGLLTAGQPAPEAWSSLARDGVGTVINLRPDTEMGDRDEAAEVAAAGLKYHSLPVAGADGITAENARALMSLIENAEGDVLVHCASGNRVGALLALAAVAEGGMDTEAAVAAGKAAGLGSLEPRVREVIEVQAVKCSAPAMAGSTKC